jgi:hypothetical protein
MRSDVGRAGLEPATNGSPVGIAMVPTDQTIGMAELAHAVTVEAAPDLRV